MFNKNGGVTAETPGVGALHINVVSYGHKHVGKGGKYFVRDYIAIYRNA